MSSVIEQLARRLDTSPARARQQLQTLLAALRSRIERNGEASLPGLGTFSRAEGAWAFEPDEALARSVNRSFEGLDAISVPAPDAGGAAAASSTPEEAAPHEETASAQEESSGEDAPAEEEALFAGLSLDDSSSRGPSPRESSDIPGDVAPSAEPSPEAASFPPAEKQREDRAKSDWAFPGPSAGASGGAAAWNYAALPAGASLVRRRTVAPSPGDVRAGRLETEDAAAPRTEDAPGHRAEGRPHEERPPKAPEPPTDRTRLPESERRATSSDGGSGTGGWLAALAVLLVVGLGGWFVLGQQGVVPGPVAVLQQGGGSGNAPPGASPGASGNRSGAAAAADSAAADTAGSPSPADSATEVRAGRLDRAEGGWTVVVASETSRDTARRAAQQFAQQFQDQDYPIDILEATVDGTPRYRVVVGQFSSREAAAQPLQQDGGPFPQGAWALQVEPDS
ncbi:MAG: hypothetical protein BRD48_06005 [Bacteroidetes bacterium QS_9_68_14]|nr:MAG: hypothetical protein BRD48_06005 [Bacteroidetes bacterium QS_9_68_14]